MRAFETRLQWWAQGSSASPLPMNCSGAASQVVLVDRDEPGRGRPTATWPSIAVTEFMPASRPSDLARKCRNGLLDPRRAGASSAMAICPNLRPGFCASSPPAARRASGNLEAAGAVLSASASMTTSFLLLLDTAGLSDELSGGRLPLVSMPTRQSSAPTVNISKCCERFGFPLDELVGGKAIRELEPELSRHGSAWRFCSRRTVQCVTRFVSSWPCSIVTARLAASSRAGRSSGFETIDGTVVRARRFKDGRKSLSLRQYCVQVPIPDGSRNG